MNYTIEGTSTDTASIVLRHEGETRVGLLHRMDGAWFLRVRDGEELWLAQRKIGWTTALCRAVKRLCAEMGFPPN